MEERLLKNDRIQQLKHQMNLEVFKQYSITIENRNGVIFILPSKEMKDYQMLFIGSLGGYLIIIIIIIIINIYIAHIQQLYALYTNIIK